MPDSRKTFNCADKLAPCVASLSLFGQAGDWPFSSRFFDAIPTIIFPHIGPSTAARISLLRKEICWLASAQDDGLLDFRVLQRSPKGSQKPCVGTFTATQPVLNPVSNNAATPEGGRFFSLHFPVVLLLLNHRLQCYKAFGLAWAADKTPQKPAHNRQSRSAA